jgi:hypothetical protein
MMSGSGFPSTTTAKRAVSPAPTSTSSMMDSNRGASGTQRVKGGERKEKDVIVTEDLPPSPLSPSATGSAECQAPPPLTPHTPEFSPGPCALPINPNVMFFTSQKQSQVQACFVGPSVFICQL